MSKYRYIIIAATLAAVVSCGNNLSTDDPADSRIPIKFAVGMATKAFLGPNDLNQANTELTIWGYAGTDPLIEGQTATYNAIDGGWNLGDEYYWGGNVKYKFFSYLTKDKNGNTAPTGLSMADSTLTVPAKTFDFAATDNDFDFCYSEVVSVPADNTSHSTVAFDLTHLYSAVAFSARNYTTDEITINEVTLYGLKNKKSATIAFTDSSKVSYPANSVSCTWTSGKKLNSADIVLDEDHTEYANIVGTASTTTQHYMFWPQDSTELKATGWTDSDTQPTGGAYLKVVYDQAGTEYTKYAQFPQDKDGTDLLGWPAGSKRMMQIAFRDNYFTLELQAAPWDYSEPTIKYDDEVRVETPLQFDSSTCTVDETNHKLYFKGANPIIGSFTLDSPEGATWVISKEGDYDAFEIDNITIGDNGLPASRYGDKVDCNFGAVNVNGNQFTIYPMDVEEGREYSIEISFSIRYPNGESFCIDDKLQVDGSNNTVKWTIILTK